MNYKIEIRIYETDTGKSPYKIWRDGLDKSIRAIIAKRLDRVRLDNFGDCTRIKDGNGIWELIIDVGPGYRIYFSKINDTIILLLIGGIKKNQSKDIEKAKKYWLDFLEE